MEKYNTGFLTLEGHELDDVARFLTWQADRQAAAKCEIYAGTLKSGKVKAGALEVKFYSFPGAEVIQDLKALKMRWNPAKKVWYGFVSRSDLLAALYGPDPCSLYGSDALDYFPA